MPLTLVPVEFWLVCFGMLGGILGSYINMAAYRLPRGISTVTRSRSFCPKCEHQLAWYDNVPILSYLSLFGKCRYCKVPIPSRYLFTELLVAFLFVVATYQFLCLNPALVWFPFTGKMPPILFAVQLFLIVDLILLSIVDLEAWLIPIETTLPWAVVGLVLAPIFPELHASATAWFAVPPAGFVNGAVRVNAVIDSFAGLVIGAGVLWAVGFAVTLGSYYWFRMKGRPDRPLEGMGLGDVHLMAMVGAMLGWKAALATLMLGVFIGAATGITKIMYENYKQKKLGDAYKPWQPEFELPPQQETAPQKPTFWMLLAMGLFVLAASLFLIWQGKQTFGFAPIQTFEEIRQGLPNSGVAFPVDFRLFPVYLLLLLGAMLVMACFFLNHLSAINMLPQGEIQENDKGEQKEVLHGNYVPFGPSLAAAGILVAFYDPLIRNVAYWWFALGPSAPFPSLPWRVLGG